MGSPSGVPASAALLGAVRVQRADVQNVEFVGQIGGATYAVAVQGNYAYVGEGPRLTILDVSNPVSPTMVGKTDPLPDVVYDVAVAGNYAYVADEYYGGLRVVDVSDPAHPTEVGSYDTPGYAYGVAVAGNYVYLADEDGGLFILHFIGAWLGSISGRVADVNGDPFPGVRVSADSQQTTTDATGAYTITNLSAGTYTITPTLAGYAFYPPTRTVTLPPDAAGQDFTILPAPVSADVPSSGGGLTLTDTQGLTTTLAFPAGAVTQTTTLVLTPTLATGGAGFAFAGHAFELAAFRGGNLLLGFSFEAPVTVTIHYSDRDVRVVSDESQLALMWWTGSGWEDAAQTCTPPSEYVRDLGNNVLSVAICHLSEFALLGPAHQVYLPLVVRGR